MSRDILLGRNFDIGIREFPLWAQTRPDLTDTTLRINTLKRREDLNSIVR